MGFGDNKATIWNIEYGYVVATININDIKPQPDTVWVKCERVRISSSMIWFKMFYLFHSRAIYLPYKI